MANVLVHSSVSVLLGHRDPMTLLPDGTFPSHVEVSTPPAPSSMAVADFDGDTHIDVITANLGKQSLTLGITDTFSFLKGDGAGSLGVPTNFAGGFLGPRSLQAADVNNDSRLDLVVVYTGSRLVQSGPTGIVSVMFGNGNGTFQTPTHYAAPEAPLAVAVGDFDKDGFKDLLTANLRPAERIRDTYHQQCRPIAE